jgi:LuxR family maltose regulon positive regulatory protein
MGRGGRATRCHFSPCAYAWNLPRRIGSRATARHLLREMDGILLHQPALGVQVEEFRRIVASSAQRGSAGESPLPRAELRLIPYQQMHLTFSEIGDRFISRNTVNTQVGSIYRKLGVSSRRDAVQHHLSVQEQMRTRNGNCASGRPMTG